LTTNQTLNNLFPYIWDNIRDIIFILSPEGLITSISREFEDTTGWKREEWIGRNFVEIVHPDDLKIVMDGFQSTIRGVPPPPYEARIKAKNGEYLILEAKGTPQIESGEIVGYLGIARDVTQRRKMEEVLKTSERQYRAILNSIGDPLHVVDRDHTILLLNPAFSKWLEELGLESEILGKTVSDAFPFLSRDVFEEYDSVFQTGKPHLTEEINEINEVKYYTDTRKIPIFNEVGSEVVQVLTIIRNITGQKLMEETLRKNEERLRSFMDAATDSFTVWDSKLNLIDINSTAKRIFQLEFPEDEIIGRNLTEFSTEPGDTFPYLQVLKTGKPFIAERTTPPIKFGDMVLSVKAFKVDDGLGIIATDITQSKLMEDGLRESEEKFRSIFANAPIGMVLVDLDFKFTQVNTSFCELFGYKEEELLKMTFLEITHPDHSKRDEKNVKKLIEGISQVYRTEKRYLKKNGLYFWANTTVTLLKDKKDCPLFLLGMIQDITIAKKQEEDLKAQLLKFKIEEGVVYLIKESSSISAQTVFEDLIKFGYNGTIISRSHKTYFQNQNVKDFSYFRMTIKNNIKIILEQVKESSKRSVLLLDRLEFLFLNNTFEDTINFIFQLNEYVYLNNSVVLLSVDPKALSDRELNILEKDTHPLEPRFIAKISEENLDILRFTFQQNKIGIKPSYSDIGKELNVSRPTARKRIKYLVSVGYLSEQKFGKTKMVELSSKGENLFLT
jgi:PAS domain S-box-containing protein